MRTQSSQQTGIVTTCSEAKAVPVYISENPVARVGVHHKTGETSISNFVKNLNYDAKNLSRIQNNLTGTVEGFSIDSNTVETL
jgi:hypothetical protein